VLGVAVAAANTVDAQTDLSALISSGRNGILKIQAVGSRNDQAGTLIALLCDLGASMLMVGANADDCDSPLDKYGPWFAAVGSVAITWLSMSQRNRRKRLLDALRLRRRVKAPDPPGR
jgi:hypothetical protein